MVPGGLARYVWLVNAFLALIAGCLLIWMVGDKFPAGNNVFHVPLVLDYANSSEGPHDAFHRSLGNFVSPYWRLVAVVATEDNIRQLFLGLLLLTSALTIGGAYAAVTAAGTRPVLALIGCIIVGCGFAVRQFMEFGGGELFAGFLTHSQLATAIGLLVAALAIRQHWVWAALFCGLAADTNLFLGFWLMVNLLLARLIVERRTQIPFSIAAYAWMAFACVAAALPTIGWAVQATGSAVKLDFSFTDYLYQYHPYHFFAHLEFWLLLSFAALAISVWLAAQRYSAVTGVYVAAALVLGSLVTILLGAASAYAVDHQVVLSLHPLRYAAVGHWFAAIAVIALWSQAEKNQESDAIFGAIAVTGFMLPTPSVTILGLLMMQRGRVSGPWLGIQLLGLGLSMITPAYSDGRFDFPLMPYVGPLPAVTLVCALAAAIIFNRRDLSNWERWAALCLTWLVACSTEIGDKTLAVAYALVVTFVAALVFSGSRRRLSIAVATTISMGCLALSVYGAGRPERRMLMTFVVMMGVVVVSYGLCRVRALKSAWILGISAVVLLAVGVTLAQRHRAGFDFPRWPADELWFDAQVWARANTPPDTLFYAPDRFGFATMSRRPVWWDANEGAAVMWSPAFYDEWNLRGKLAERAKAANGLIELARSEGIEFLVLDCQRMTSLQGVEVRYSNERYCIAEVVASRQ